MRKCWHLSILMGCCLPWFVVGQTSNSSLPTSAQSEIFLQMQKMQNQITQLQGALEEQQLLINKLQQESLERYQELDKRLSSGSTQTIDQAKSVPDNSNQNSNANTQATEQVNAAKADPEKEKLYYEAAFSLIKKKDYPKAAQAFTAFLQRYPSSQYAGNAQYWLAEVSLAQGNTQQAANEFNKVFELYPNHAKVPDAMYKLAGAQQKLGNTEKAKATYQQLITKYPKTSAATLAKQSLQNL